MQAIVTASAPQVIAGVEHRGVLPRGGDPTGPSPHASYRNLEESGMAQQRVKPWLSELTGTATLLFGSVLMTRWLFGPRSALADAVTDMFARLAVVGALTGALLVFLIASPLGGSSGGHFNPAVSVTMWLTRSLSGRDAAAYVTAQLVGSVAGVLLARLALGPTVADPTVRYAAIHPNGHWSPVGILLGEAVMLMLLMAPVLLLVAHGTPASRTAVVIGVTVSVLIPLGGLASGGSFNPARQLGPLLFADQWSALWPYLLGPVLGALALGLPVRRMGERMTSPGTASRARC
jgi:glycerol uptake facilitator-like aquaporin